MKYRVIYADPPWTFKVYSDKGKGRSAEAHYDVMTLSEIKAFPCKDFAADDCVLFLWTTDPMLPYSLEVLDAWEFTFKTVGFYWVKPNFMGTGYWTRANPEQCLLATRGHPKRVNNNVRKLVTAQLCDGPYLDAFARQRHPGWDCVGDEVDTGPQPRKWRSNMKTAPLYFPPLSDFLID